MLTSKYLYHYCVLSPLLISLQLYNVQAVLSLEILFYLWVIIALVGLQPLSSKHTYYALLRSCSHAIFNFKGTYLIAITTLHTNRARKHLDASDL